MSIKIATSLGSCKKQLCSTPRTVPSVRPTHVSNELRGGLLRRILSCGLMQQMPLGETTVRALESNKGSSLLADGTCMCK